MNANDSLERGIADVYEREAPRRAPDWVLAGALDTIESTPQRRVLTRVPWRIPTMNTYLKWAVAAVAVIGVGAVGLAMLRPAAAPSVGGPNVASPSPSPSPSLSPDPHAPPPLDATFTSTVNGISVSYPTGWVTKPATEAWTATSDPNFGSAARDQIYDPVLRDHLFLTMASQPLAGKTGDAWVAAVLAQPDEGCGTSSVEATTIDGTPARMCDSLAALSVGDRGYFFKLYTSDDEAWLATSYDRAWFATVLDTVKLDTSRAVDASPST